MKQSKSTPEQDSRLDRRGFLKSSSVIAGGAAALGALSSGRRFSARTWGRGRWRTPRGRWRARWRARGCGRGGRQAAQVSGGGLRLRGQGLRASQAAHAHPHRREALQGAPTSLSASGSTFASSSLVSSSFRCRRFYEILLLFIWRREHFIRVVIRNVLQTHLSHGIFFGPIVLYKR